MGTGRYVLLERIGTGGMAEVFRASMTGAEGFERPVAIKRILPSFAADEEFIRMFVDEAKIAVQLQHPNIVQIFDLGRDGNEYFIAMEYVQGKDLRAIQERLARAKERVPLAVALHVVMRVCEALHHAHLATAHNGQSLGVVHRDVTPQNVLVSYDGEVKVTDFGLAKAAGRALETQNGVLKGKLAYMAPEAYAGLVVDHRADVFGAGILLWEMLAGRSLFQGANDHETIERARLAIVPSLRAIDSAIPSDIERIVQSALARDRDRRYPSAETLREELEAFTYERQEFLTTSALASWLREWFPLDPPRAAPIASVGRRRDVATREIELSDVPRSPAPITLVPATPLDPAPSISIVEELDVDELEEVDVEVEAVDSIPPPLGPEHEEEMTTRVPSTAMLQERYRFLDDGGPATVPILFDDTTGNKTPPINTEPPTVQHYDDDPRHQTMPQASDDPTPPLDSTLIESTSGSVPLQGLSWDDEEEATEVGPPVRKPE